MSQFMRRSRHRKDQALEKMFQTRSHAWEQVGLARQVSVQAARRAKGEALVLIPALVGVMLAYTYRQRLFGLDMPVRIATVVALLILGWAFARAVGRAAGPSLFRRLDPATAGTVGFLIRLATIAITLLAALRIAGLRPETLAVGGAFTAVIVGLAAQQTLGNVIAGLVLLSARPFKVGERVRLQGGGVAGSTEGVVSSLGLLYLTLSSGEDRIMVPNAVALNLAAIPLREPDAVDMRARVPAAVRPSDLQRALANGLTVVTRDAPDIRLEEMDGDEVVVRISATPERSSEGHQLADEVIAAVASVTELGDDSPTIEHAAVAGEEHATPPHGNGNGNGGPSDTTADRGWRQAP
jgi:small-conductance mechanosensitive channel